MGKAWRWREKTHASSPKRLGDGERRLMHLVPAPAVRLKKRRVLSRPGVNSLLALGFLFIIHFSLSLISIFLLVFFYLFVIFSFYLYPLFIKSFPLGSFVLLHLLLSSQHLFYFF